MGMNYYDLLSSRSLTEQRNDALLKMMSGKSNRKSQGSSLNLVKNGQRDQFIKSEGELYLSDPYTAVKCNQKLIPKDLVDFLNNSHSYGMHRKDGTYIVRGCIFNVDQIPPVDGGSLQEVKAVDNILDFGKQRFFKYISSDGEEHYLNSNKSGGLNHIRTELMRGAPFDKTLERYAYFWNYLMGDITFLSLNYTLEEKEKYLEEAGIKPGFFTVKMGDEESTKYDSQGECSVVIYEKKRYDDLYRSITESGGFRETKPGSIFMIGSKEYVLSENHTLDIPYGEDIFGMKYPDDYGHEAPD